MAYRDRDEWQGREGQPGRRSEWDNERREQYGGWEYDRDYDYGHIRGRGSYDRDDAYGSRGYGGSTYDRDFSSGRRPSYTQSYGGSDYGRGSGYGREYDRGYGAGSDYEYSRYGRGNYSRDYEGDYDYGRSGQYGGGYGQQSGQYGGGPGQGSQYGGGYGRGSQYSGYNRGGQYGRGGADRGYDYRRQQSYGRNYGRDYDYEQESDYGEPVWSYMEVWYIPGPETGRGPQGYQRSMERIHEDVCERLTQHGRVDASNIEVKVENGEVTLTGTVNSRQEKRMAEETVESVMGVTEVHNQLRVKRDQFEGETEQQQTENQRQTETRRT
jgi:osmotically-inducible protein OsmY